MFFNNHLIFLSLKFFWVGLIFGLVYILFYMTGKVCKKNIYVCNVLGFCYFLSFGFCYSLMSISLYNYSFCWFGLVFMLAGFYLVKKTQQIFFTKIAWLLYNKTANRKQKRKDISGKLQASQKS